MLNYSIHTSVASKSQIPMVEEELHSIQDKLCKVEKKMEETSGDKEVMTLQLQEMLLLIQKENQLLKNQLLLLGKVSQPPTGMYLNNN